MKIIIKINKLKVVERKKYLNNLSLMFSNGNKISYNNCNIMAQKEPVNKCNDWLQGTAKSSLPHHKMSSCY